MISSFAISVLIRTHNSARTLERVVSGLGLEKGDEVVVVDSGSRDTTLEIARKLGASVVIAPGSFNYSKSLNYGFKAAKNPWVLVLSSHAIPIVPRFLDVHRAAIRQFPPDVAVGYAPSTISVSAYADALPGDVSFYSAETYQTVENRCGNGNAIYRRSIWERLPFDEAIRTAEDKLWLREIVKRGGRIAWIPAARTLNCNQASLTYMFKKGYSDACARSQKNKESSHENLRPMGVYQLGGALKNLLVQKLQGEVNTANWLRYSAHIFGQFFGSRRQQNNSPTWKNIA